jgi:SPP1 gp7 family putative phage head morphogenesis protein
MRRNNSVLISQIKARQRAREKRGKSNQILPRRPTYPLTLERKYKNKLVEKIREAIRLVEERLVPLLPMYIQEIKLSTGKNDSFVEDVARVIAGIRVTFAQKISDIQNERDAQEVAQGVNAIGEENVNNQFKSLVGVAPFRSEPWLAATMGNFVQQNVSLITSVSSEYFKNIETAVLTGLERGQTAADIGAVIAEKAGISERRAELIARDQVSSLNSHIASKRAESIGIKSFIWSTSGDERVRESHAELNNKKFTYENGAYVDGESGVLPGEPINCRCVAIPIISSIDEDYSPSNDLKSYLRTIK